MFSLKELVLNTNSFSLKRELIKAFKNYTTVNSIKKILT